MVGQENLQSVPRWMRSANYPAHPNYKYYVCQKLIYILQ